MKYTIATGNIVDGFKLFGIFDSQEEALNALEDDRRFANCDTPIVPIEEV